MRFYKTGNDFAADMKRQIHAVRAAVIARQVRNGDEPLGPVAFVPKSVPVLTPDGEQAYHEALTVDDSGEDVIRRVPSMTVKFFPVPATISPQAYHRLGGVR